MVEETGGFKDRRWEAFLLGEYEGSREDALAQLLERAKAFKPEHPRIVRRQRIFAVTDGYLVLSKGATETFHHRFSVAELIHDSAPKKR